MYLLVNACSAMILFMGENKTKKPQVRLSAAERRQMIIQIAGTLFAKKGFHGVTTREIATACGVSEPVLYQHFNTKEEIYNGLNSLCKDSTTLTKRLLRQRSAQTETLCFFVYLTVSMIALGKTPGDSTASEDTKNIVRLTGYSFLEDGHFLKSVLKSCIGSLFEDWQNLYRAALKSGDLNVRSADDKALWAAYELMVGSALFHLTGPRVLPDLHGDEDEYLQQVSLFVLRGLGLKESALKTHFKPKAWVKDVQSFLKSGI